MNEGEARQRTLADRMLTEAGKAQRYARRGKAAFFDEGNEETRDLVQLYVGHVLETATKLGEPFQNANPLIDWTRLHELRQDVIHGYADRLQPEVLWAFVRDELPGVVRKLRRARFPSSPDDL